MNKLPTELINIIYEYNAEHRHNFRSALSEIPIKGMIKRLNHISKIYQNQGGSYGRVSFDTVMEESIDDKAYMCHVLSKCNCCERHKYRRPKNLNDLRWRYSAYIKIHSQKNCGCKCRHASRWLCHMSANNYNHTYVDYNNDNNDYLETYEYDYDYTYEDARWAYDNTYYPEGEI